MSPQNDTGRAISGGVQTRRYQVARLSGASVFLVA